MDSSPQEPRSEILFSQNTGSQSGHLEIPGGLCDCHHRDGWSGSSGLLVSRG